MKKFIMLAVIAGSCVGMNAMEQKLKGAETELTALKEKKKEIKRQKQVAMLQHKLELVEHYEKRNALAVEIGKESLDSQEKRDQVNTLLHWEETRLTSFVQRFEDRSHQGDGGAIVCSGYEHRTSSVCPLQWWNFKKTQVGTTIFGNPRYVEENSIRPTAEVLQDHYTCLQQEKASALSQLQKLETRD